MAKKALARQSDVEPSSVTAEMVHEGRVSFEAKPGHSLDLEKIHACLQETRLSGKPPGRVTSCQFRYLEITARGELVKDGKGLLLRVNGTQQVFRLADEPGPKAITLEGTAFERLQRAVDKGEKVVVVTGQVKGWSGHSPAVLRALPAEFDEDPDILVKLPVRLPPLVYVTEFELPKK